MKKSILFLSTFLLISCNFNNINQSNNSNNIDVNKLEDIINSKTLTIQETTMADDVLVNTKVGMFDIQNTFKAYSFVLNKANYFYNTNLNAKNVEEFVLNDDYLIQFSNSKFTFKCDNSSILAFKGLDAFFNNMLQNNNSVVSSSLCEALIRDTYYDLGHMVDYESFIDNFDIGYQFLTTDNNLTLEVDITNIYKKLFPLVKKVTKTYNFEKGYDESLFVDYPTNKDDNTSSDEEKDNELKQYSSTYIKNIFTQLKYVSNDISFVNSCPKSRRLTYKYSSSRKDILEDNGTFHAPSQDENIELTISLLLDEVEFETQKYTFVAYAPIARSGTLGTKENPIYQGRKEIDKVEIYFIEMHKQYGDSIYIKAGDFDMLIDAGQQEDGTYVVNFLKEHCVDTHLDLVVTTHAHSDHIGGMTSVLNWTSGITYSLDYGYQRSSYHLSETVRESMKNKSTYYSPVTEALKVNNGIIQISDDFYITLLDTGQYLEPTEDIGNGDDNSASVTFILTYKNHSYYFSGDLDKSGENYLVNTKQLKDVDLMKASHHASNTGNSANLLNEIKPEVVAVSTALVKKGSVNEDSASQAHPNANALSRFYNANAKVYCNFTMGTIHVTSYGTGSLDVEGLGVIEPYYMSGKLVTGEENKEFKDTVWANRYRR